eukprot:TRINITY_DN4447_c0_g1_i1.p1 TRINITY_DN4447_c0_g1~~TRINITY_DN4447_c0_g1_i1.p1  ORF type:complete len:295 (+),score=44.22 TRINITY_DN4447_c0_g1_i1:99-887(+)
MLRSLVGSEMCIRDRVSTQSTGDCWPLKMADKLLSAAAVTTAGAAIVCYANQGDPSRRVQGRAAEHITKLKPGDLYDLQLCQYERWLPISGWGAKNLHFYERTALSDERGEAIYGWCPEKNSPVIELPDGWSWANEWESEPNWEYGFNWFSGWKNTCRWYCRVRRRRWSRTMCCKQGVLPPQACIIQGCRGTPPEGDANQSGNIPAAAIVQPTELAESPDHLGESWVDLGQKTPSGMSRSFENGNFPLDAVVDTRTSKGTPP